MEAIVALKETLGADTSQEANGEVDGEVGGVLAIILGSGKKEPRRVNNK
jgi:hypothetical protein